MNHEKTPKDVASRSEWRRMIDEARRAVEYQPETPDQAADQLEQALCCSGLDEPADADTRMQILAQAVVQAIALLRGLPDSKNSQIVQKTY